MLYSEKIHNKMLEIVNNYDYKEDVEKYTEEVRDSLEKKHSNYIICLYANFSSDFRGNSDEEVAKKVANEVIRYRIKEKAFIKLMSEGIICPIGICDGWNYKSVTYSIRNTTVSADLGIRRIVFNEFIKA